MQIVGKRCALCDSTIIAEIDTAGCHLCDVAFHLKCLQDPTKCPSCGRDFQLLQAMAREQEQQEQEKLSDTGRFAPERTGVRMGVLGGLVMMVIAVIWFGLGLAAGVIFYYPPILFSIGVFALLKGLLTGNISGPR